MGFRVFFVFAVLLVYGCSTKHEPVHTQEVAKSPKKPFFVSVPIVQFSATQCPCIDVEIDGSVFTMKLDLGLRGDLSIIENCIDQIPLKTLVDTRPMYGIKGNPCETNFYQIPTVKIGAMTFFQPILQEERLELAKGGVFVQNGEEPAFRNPGVIGWELFWNTNLLVDAKNSVIAFCDSLDTLKQYDYAVDTFVRTPLLLERGLVEIDVQATDRSLRCVLDTGCTWNLLNTELSDNQSLERAVWDPNNVWESSSLQIAGEEFGPSIFRRIPIKIPIFLEAFLGMEFFRDHLVFLDFAGGYAYVAKHPADNTLSQP